MRNTLRAAGLLLALTVGSGCAAPISGTPKPGLTPVDLASLKTGAQITEPTEFTEKFPSGTSERIRLIEGRRLLDVLVPPMDFHPSATELGYTRIFASPDTMSKTGGIPAQYNEAVGTNNFVVGVSASRTNGSVRTPESGLIGILQFATEQDAKNAAAAMFQVTMSGETPRHPVSIPGYPNANASSADDSSANAFQQHGPFVVVSAVVQAAPGVDGLAEKLGKSMASQLPALDKFKIVAPDDLMDLPRDQDGIVRRTMGKSPAGDPYGMSFYDEDSGTFLPSGILHYERDPVRARKAFEEAGVDLIGRRYSTVYRARDVEAAFKLQTALAAPGKDDAEIDSPPGIADARCLRLGEADKNRGYNSLCVLVYDRYVAVVMSLTSASKTSLQSDPVLHERTAAQYAILKKSE
ncbi:DUF7373 family lipoprotein [Nocardia caishijiensis]|uniref:Secreted protein n=1 Tax=Nocardia caishijiensis TaxID=184756 RepID=A0ABQ6YRD3_9NOCA|nr:hypothetical protein [Nocardia caishijiensis]KAF0848335.1 hypothetical protein FNL39_102483 [Nocardia caishijiensis]